MVEIRKFAHADLEALLPKVRESFQDELTWGHLSIQQGSYAISVFGKEGPIAAIGGHPVAPGVLQAWALVSKDACQYPLEFTRSVKVVVEEFLRDYHRIQMVVRAGYENENRWARILGFKPEGLLKSYGKDRSDYTMYGRLA